MGEKMHSDFKEEIKLCLRWHDVTYIENFKEPLKNCWANKQIQQGYKIKIKYKTQFTITVNNLKVKLRKQFYL